MKSSLYSISLSLLIAIVSYAQTANFPPGYDCVLDSPKGAITSAPSTKKIGVFYIQFADYATNYRARGSVKTTVSPTYYSYSDYNDQVFSINTYITPEPLEPFSTPKSVDGRVIFGSVRDYWDDVSYSQFSFASGSGIINPSVTINGQVRVEWLTAPYDKSYYGSLSEGDALNPLYNFAVNQAISNGWISSSADFEAYAIVYAGEHEGDGLWPCQSGNHFMTPERMWDGNDAQRHLTGIYFLCHEFGHILTLGDIRGISSGDGLGDFSLMGTFDSPEFNIELERPPHLSCYEKELLGWLTPTTITSDEISRSISNIENNAFALKIPIYGVSNEYFLIENRQPTGFDFTFQNFSTQTGGGLLVYHKAPYPFGNQETIKIIEADGSNDLDSEGGNTGDLGDFFPGISNVRSLTDITTPNSIMQSGAHSHVAMFNVSNSSSTMTADFHPNAWAGTITSNTTWSSDVYIYDDLHIEDGIVMTVSANVKVAAGKTLTIDPGVIFNFAEGKELDVYGTLNAQGTSPNPIVFTSASGNPSPGDWDGIWIMSGASCNMDYTEIYGAEYGVHAASATIDVDDCIFEDDETGLYLSYINATVTLDRCDFIDCVYGRRGI